MIVSVFVFLCLFFFKQKTAYEMRISDWSSDVCSSDLRDFLQGAAITAAAFGLAPELAQAAALERAAQDQPGYYPPALTGMRGSHPGSFEDAHALRDGPAFDHVTDTGESYDLIVVGGGISGLSTAHFFRPAKGPTARILVLSTPDDLAGPTPP